MDNKTDPVIVDLLNWLKDNLPPDADADDYIFRKVRRVQKAFDTLMGLTFEEFYNHAMSIAQDPKDDCHTPAIPEDDSQGSSILKDDCQSPTFLEDAVSEKLKDMRDLITLNEEKQLKTQKLKASRTKLELKREQYQLITSIKLDGCMDLISRYNHLMSKK